jgi:adenylate kinase family enzyme
VLLEDFPQSEFQAKFFTKNCVSPSRVFALECSKDLCQERMTLMAQNDASYQPSAILSKRIRMYNENAKHLMPYLEANTNLRCVNTEQNFDLALTQLCSYVEPTVLLVRPGGAPDAYERRQQIIEQLKTCKGFKELNVFSLIKEETERHTEVGCEINAQISAGKDYQRDLDHLVVRMLKKIIYSGIEGRDKFILSDFPDTIKQTQAFEQDCAKITAVIFASGSQKVADEDVHELVDNGLSIDTIDTLL